MNPRVFQVTFCVDVVASDEDEAREAAQEKIQNGCWHYWDADEICDDCDAEIDKRRDGD